ncbi:transcriptional repressor [Acuticoccus sp. M5D2P5]|uniref:Fur family transcriptional regulator n=1 Tax=Acuticoccus kalidii TaxID=2910977 RepID=UPI001F456B84|nr:Fur family transcriptional regulator [Acuticoccus kalidii]MCF3933105.1 transcriptional repressor [Acuticoccus kalidii]
MMKRSRVSSRNHEHVYRVLQSAKGPMSAYQVLDQVREHGISAPPTVYRALDYLVDQGQVHRLESINAYVACRDPKHVHTVPVFAICADCGGIDELPGVGVLTALEAQAQGIGFVMEGATVEIKGRCAACAGENEDA